MNVDPLGNRAERRIRAAWPRRLVVGERQGGLLRLAVSEPECELDAASQRVGLRLGRGSVFVRADDQPAAIEHLRQPASDPIGESRKLVQRGRWRWVKAERPVRLLVPNSVGDEHVQVRMNVEARSSPSQDRDPAYARCGSAYAPSLPGHHRVVDQPHGRAQDRRSKGE